jgi:pimeloyl-ACP methyl ester carboxylesterase
VPALIIYDRDRYTQFDMLPGVLHRNPNIRAVKVAPTLGLPHFERPDATFAALDEFWQSLG